MRNKIISAVLAIMLICINTVQISFAEDISDADLKMANELKGYGILKGDENNNLNLDQPITRTEMAVLVLRMLSYENMTGSDKNAFPDVKNDFWGYNSIELAHDLNIISGFEDGTFRPENDVLSEQAIKMIVAALGYENVMPADKTYPDSYIDIATQLNILKSVTYMVGEAITRGNVARIIYNSLDVSVIEKQITTNTATTSDTTKTLLERLEDHKNLYSYDGVVTATHDTDLYSSEPLSNANTVKINGTVFTAADGINVAKFLGKTVTYFVDEDKSGNDKIKSIEEKPGKNHEISISDMFDVEKPSGLDIKYYDNNKSTDLKLSQNYTVALNGRLYSPLFDYDYFKTIDATLRFIDNDDDDKYDVVFVEGCESAVVDKAIPESNVIALKYDMKINGSKTISCDETKVADGDITITDKGGKTLALSDIQPEDSVSVFYSNNAKRMRIVVTSDNVTGTVSAVNSNDCEVVADGTTYNVVPDANGISSVSVDTATTYKLFLNSRGKVFYADERNTTTDASGKVVSTYYYVMNKYNDANQEIATVKLLSANKEIKQFDMASKATVNGKSCNTSTAIYDAVPVGEIVMVLFNSDNKIKKVTTVDKLQDKSALRTYTDEYNDDNERIRFDGTQIFTTSSSKPFAVNENTAMFFVPTSSTPGVTYDDEYYKETYSLTRKKSYWTQAYDFDSDTQIAKAVIIQVQPETDKKLNITDDSPIGIVSKVSKEINSDDEEVIAMDMYVSGKEVKNTVKTDSSYYTLAEDVKKGDVIRYRIAYDGNVAEMERLFTLSDVSGYNYFHTGANSNEEKYFGKVKNMDLNLLSKSSNVYVNQVTLLNENNETADSFEFQTNVNNIFKISSDKSNSAEFASFYDISCADDVGNDDASKIFMYRDMTKTLFVVIFN